MQYSLQRDQCLEEYDNGIIKRFPSIFNFYLLHLCQNCNWITIPGALTAELRKVGDHVEPPYRLFFMYRSCALGWLRNKSLTNL